MYICSMSVIFSSNWAHSRKSKSSEQTPLDIDDLSKSLSSIDLNPEKRRLFETMSDHKVCKCELDEVPVLTGSELDSQHCCIFEVAIPVDPNLPEQNATCGNVIILKATDLKGLERSKYAGRTYDGFLVCAKVDLRWFQLDAVTQHYSLVQQNDSQLLLKYPAWDYDMLNSRDDLPDGNVKDGLDHAHSGLSETLVPDPRQYLYLNLQFKPPVKLSGEVLYPNFEETLTVPNTKKVKFRGGARFIVWEIARVDTDSFKRGKREAKKGQSSGADLFLDDMEEGEEW